LSESVEFGPQFVQIEVKLAHTALHP
jgi:hypothetical protein